MKTKIFFSKILLFGEYGIIHDSMGLAIPYPLFHGELTFPSEGRANAAIVDNELRALAKYLKGISKKHMELNSFADDSFEFDVSQGLYFHSTIPQGYGVGSSGALCASIFERYHEDVKELNYIKKDHLKELKNVFSLMESHFHGASSGIDPLISFLNRPILIKSMDNIEQVEVPDFSKKSEGGIFLLNTQRPRRTEPLVNLFLEKCKKRSYRSICEKVLLPITNGCINSFMNEDKTSLYEFFRELSDFQYRHFTQMIPNLYKDIWNDGLKSECYYLKLCGAGGGGFLLGMAKNFDEAKEKLQGHEIRPLYYF